MDNENRCCGNPFWTFLARIMILVKIALFIAGIFIVFVGVFLCRSQYKDAKDPIEATYWYIRYWGFLLAAYGIILLVAVVFYVNSGRSLFSFLQYWPAVCMLFLEDCWFGSWNHELALMYETVFMGVMSYVINLLAGIYGKYDWDWDSFTPSRLAKRHWIDRQIGQLYRRHPSSIQGFDRYSRADQAAMIARWYVSYGKRIEALQKERLAYV